MKIYNRWTLSEKITTIYLLLNRYSAKSSNKMFKIKETYLVFDLIENCVRKLQPLIQWYHKNSTIYQRGKAKTIFLTNISIFTLANLKVLFVQHLIYISQLSSSFCLVISSFQTFLCRIFRAQSPRFILDAQNFNSCLMIFNSSY